MVVHAFVKGETPMRTGDVALLGMLFCWIFAMAVTGIESNATYTDDLQKVALQDLSDTLRPGSKKSK